MSAALVTGVGVGDAARAAYVAAFPAVGPLGVHCPACSAAPRRSCLTDGGSVAAHPVRVALAQRVTDERMAEADRAAEGACRIADRLAAGVTPSRMGRVVGREIRVAYLVAYGWSPLYCTVSSPWRAPYPQMPDRYSLSFAFAWTVQEHARFLGPDLHDGEAL